MQKDPIAEVRGQIAEVNPVPRGFRFKLEAKS